MMKKGSGSMTIGIIGAMKKEMDGLTERMTDVKTETVSGIVYYAGKLCGKSVVAAVSGVGKVSAAVCAQTMLLKYAPDAVVCCGVAGGLSDNLCVCDIAIADRVVQHDMDTSGVGDPVGLISGLNLIEIPCDPRIVQALQHATDAVSIHAETGIIATGDQFVCNDTQRKHILRQFHAIAAEMEGGSIGQVCRMNGVPFGVMRAISDSAGYDSAFSYAEFAETAAKHSVEIVINFLKEIGA
jgi:adenosylhomocysteine nucleosidase